MENTCEKFTVNIIETLGLSYEDNYAYIYSQSELLHQAGVETGIREMQKRRQCPVVQLTLDGHPIKLWPNIHEAYKATGVDRSSISKVCKGKLKTAGDFKWQYSKI